MHKSRSAVRAAFLIGLSTALVSGVASAAIPTGVKGDPQPELKPFNVASKSEAASTTAMLSSGTMLIAYYRSDTTTDVCTLPRGATKCSHITTIDSPAGATLFSVPQVFAAGADYVGLMTNTVSGELYYASTDGGRVFGAGTAVGGGELSADESTLAGTNVVFSDNEDHDGLQVASFSILDPTSVAPAVISETPASETAIGTYKGGVILADTPDNADTVNVWYAAAGSAFNTAGSYRLVGSFANEQLLGVSGSALLAVSTKSKEPDEIRFFNGTSYGAAHAVPKFDGTLGHENVVIQDSHGLTNVFQEGAPDPKGLTDYDLYRESTTTGSHWSALENYGTATKWNDYSGALDKNASGAIVGGETPVHVWPILQDAHVTLKLAHSSVKVGHSVTATGKSSPAAAGRKVALQRLVSKKWHTVANSTESSTGKFTFHITEHTAATYKFRAVSNDKPGYVEFGYSSSHSLTVKKA